jgi:hypothetical protein
VSVKHQRWRLAAQTPLRHMSDIGQKVPVQGRNTQNSLPRC